jgi:chromosome segregation ATPase
MMTTEEYLRHYIEPLQPSQLKSGPSRNGTELALERGYYYPPYLQQEAYLDTLSRSELLGIAQQILNTEYPRQRLIRPQVGEYLEHLQALKEEWAWQQTEMDRLNGELAWRNAEMANLGAERKRLETLVLDCRSQIAILENERTTLRATLADLRASASWKVMAPLRRISQTLKALRTPGD